MTVVADAGLTRDQDNYVRLQRPLYDTGRLRSSIQVVGKDYTGAVKWIDISSPLDYGRKHDLGEGVTARPFLHLTEADAKELGEILVATLQKG